MSFAFKCPTYQHRFYSLHRRWFYQYQQYSDYSQCILDGKKRIYHYCNFNMAPSIIHILGEVYLHLKIALEITRQNGKLYQYDENAPRPYFTFYVILIIFQKQLWKKWNTVKFDMLLVSSTTQPSSFISKKGEVEWTEPNSSGGPKYLHIDAQKWKKK